jgi:hypothetical protein
MEEAAIDIASMAEDIIKKHAPVLGHKAHGQAANWGDWKDHIEFEDGSLEAVFNKLGAAWDGQNRTVATKRTVIGFGGCSYLSLYPDGTYCFYETAT